MPGMDRDSLSRLDLNLLLALHALLTERNMTRAGHRLGITQSAMSRSLARLRASFGDPLLVRSGRSMILTPRAEELLEPLGRVLEEVRHLVRPRTFDPARDHATIKINTPSVLALPEALLEIAATAPFLNVIVTNKWADPLAALVRGDCDLLVDTIRPSSDLFRHVRLATGRFVCLVRSGHRVAAQGKLDRATFAALTHVIIDVATRRVLDEVIEHYGVERHSTLTISNSVVAAEVVSKTDWILTTPEAIAPRLCGMFPLTMLKFPFDCPDLWLDIVWHRRSDPDPMHRWVREKVIEVISQL